MSCTDTCSTNNTKAANSPTNSIGISCSSSSNAECLYTSSIIRKDKSSYLKQCLLRISDTTFILLGTDYDNTFLIASNSVGNLDSSLGILPNLLNPMPTFPNNLPNLRRGHHNPKQNIIPHSLALGGLGLGGIRGGFTGPFGCGSARIVVGGLRVDRLRGKRVLGHGNRTVLISSVVLLGIREGEG
uniref:Uncharacterized protein n=1 Tax=Opuntia streptacantha TaxID=393608 RepID=A0A7C9CPB8_OPUST